MTMPTMEGTWIIMFIAIGLFLFAIWYIVREFRSNKSKYNAKSIIHLMEIEERDDARIHKGTFKNKMLKLSGDDTIPPVELGKLMYAYIGDQFIKFYYRASLFKWKKVSAHYKTVSSGLDSNEIILDARTIKTLNRESVAVPSSDAIITWEEVRDAFIVDRINNTMSYTITFLSDQLIRSVIEASTKKFSKGEDSMLKDFDISNKMTKIKEGFNADN